MRPPPDCRPSLGGSAPKGTCRWLSSFGGSTVRTAWNYNYHRAAERILYDLNTGHGIVSGRVALLPRSTEIQPFVAKIRPSPFPITSSSPKPKVITIPTLITSLFKKPNLRLMTVAPFVFSHISTYRAHFVTPLGTSTMASHDTGSAAVIHGQAVKSSDWWSASMVDARSSNTPTHEQKGGEEEGHR
ncbi:LOW QUALITY PROTEIN: hypothetical protein YC2023_098708 [Brassica napus]